MLNVGRVYSAGAGITSGNRVKCTHAHQSIIVNAVRGTAIANKSQKFLAKVICPLSVCTNSVEKKF